MAMNNHLQVARIGKNIYCYKNKKIIEFSYGKDSFFNNECLKCPYFRGTGQGDTIECYFEDGTKDPIQWFRYPEQMEKIMQDFDNKKLKLIEKLK